MRPEPLDLLSDIDGAVELSIGVGVPIVGEPAVGGLAPLDVAGGATGVGVAERSLGTTRIPADAVGPPSWLAMTVN